MPDDARSPLEPAPRRPAPRPVVKRTPLLPNGVVGMIVFILCEMTFFAGLMTAFVVGEATARPGMWPPPNQPRLPAAETAINTIALLVSGVVVVLAHRRFNQAPRRALLPLGITIALGGFFVGFQGLEWSALLRQGMGLTSSNLSSFFYTIVGTHALHAVVALGMLLWAFVQLLRNKLRAAELWTVETFWLFVVGLWPVLYWMVYLPRRS